MKSAKQFLRLWAMCLLSAVFFSFGSNKLQAQDTWEKVSAATELAAGDEVIIVAETNAFNGQISTAPWGGFVSVTVNNNSITTSAATELTDDAKPHAFIVEFNAEKLSLRGKLGEGYLQGEKSANKIKYSHTAVTITLTEKGIHDVDSNSNLRLNGTSGFRFYKNDGTTGKKTELYKKQAVTECGKASGLTAIAQQTTAMLSWTAPEPAPAQGYAVKVMAGAQTVKEETVKTTFLQLTDLTAGTEYTYSVTAQCTAELAGETVTGTFTTKAADAVSVTATAPAEAAVFNDDVTFSWTTANFVLDDTKMVRLVISNGTQDTTLYSKEASIAVELGNGSYTATYSLVNVSGEGDNKTYAPVEGATDVRHFTVKDVLVKVANISELRKAKQGGFYKVTGEVILTAKDANRNYKWFQDKEAAILIDDLAGLVTSAYEVGDAVTGIYGRLDNYGKQLQLVAIGNLPEASSHNNQFDTLEVTIPELKADIEKYCSRMVRINGLSLLDISGDWKGNQASKAVKERDTVTIHTFVRNGDFVNQPKPQGTFDLVALAGVYNGAVQVSPRYQSDIIRLRESVKNPTFNLRADTVYPEAQKLVISSETSDATIHYTVDGSTPTAESEVFDGEITITRSQIIKAIAVKEDFDNSYVQSLFVKVGVEVFKESFDHIGGDINTAIADLDKVLPGWSGKVYPGDKCIKLGTSSAKGSVTLPVQNLSFDEGNYAIAFTAQAWAKDTTAIRLSVNDSNVSVTGLDNSGTYDEAHRKEYGFTFDNGSDATEITFEAIKASKNRFFIDSVRIYQVMPTEPTLIFAKTQEISTVQTISATKKVTVKGWLLEAGAKVICPQGNFSVSPDTLTKEALLGKSGADFTVTYNGTSLKDSVKIAIKSGSLEDTLTVYAVAEELHAVADLDALRKGTEGNYYKVSGQVILTAADTYRNYKWVQDEKSGILIDDQTGLVTTEYEIGDGITGVYGKLGSFGGQLQLIMIGNLPEASTHDNKVEPDTVTIAALNANMEKYCSRLICIKGLTLKDEYAEGEWVDNANNWATDGKDEINVRTFVRNGNFVGEAKPEGKFNLVAIAGVYKENANTDMVAQVSPRTKDDIMTVTDTTANRAMEQVVAGVYPNPTSGLVYVELTENVRMEIFTVSGAIVRTATLFAGKNEVVFSHSGIYFIRLSNANGTIVKRVVVR